MVQLLICKLWDVWLTWNPFHASGGTQYKILVSDVVDATVASSVLASLAPSSSLNLVTVSVRQWDPFEKPR